MDLLNHIIDLSLRHRMLVIGAAVVAAIAGLFAVRHLDIDAFPDTTPVQVQINTVTPALGPEEVERQITFPIEQAIGGLPGSCIVAVDFEVRTFAGRRHVRRRRPTSTSPAR